MPPDIGNKVQNLPYLLLAHESRSPVGALAGVNQIPIPVIFAGVAVAHAHHHEDEKGYNRRADTHTVKTVRKTKRRGEADKKAGIRQLRGGSEDRPGGLPRCIICDELGKESASVEERGDRGGNGDAQLALYSDQIVDMTLDIGGTPYSWIMTSALPDLSFADFNSVLLTIIGVCANGAVALIVLILLLILAWNYIKLLFEAAERYVLLGVLVFTAPVAFTMGASQATSNIFKSWCRMFAGQMFLLVMNAWCLRLFVSMVGTFIANPLSI